MNYNHLTIEERCCIRKYYNEGKSFREIAILIGRNVSTISREILHIFANIKFLLRCCTFILTQSASFTNIFAFSKKENDDNVCVNKIFSGSKR